jgi:metallo-beta-lactamase family protein
MGKSKKIRVRFIGKNADDVTGSMILVEMQDYKILLDCGLYQSSNIKDDYKINSRKLEFKSSDIDYIFINHAHIDHIGL